MTGEAKLRPARQRVAQQPRERDAELAALERLLAIAKSDTGQSRRVANFLLAWWNAGRDGGFDFTDLWMVDAAIADDMVTVIAMIRRHRGYPDSLGYREDFEKLVVLWRGNRRKRRARV